MRNVKLVVVLMVLPAVLALAACDGAPSSPVNVGSGSADLQATARVDNGDNPVSFWWQIAPTQSGIGAANANGSTARCSSGPLNVPSGTYRPLACRVTGLAPGTTYFYKFCGDTSKTDPVCGGTIQQVTTTTASVCPAIGSFGVDSSGIGTWPRSCWRPYSDSGTSWSPFNRTIAGILDSSDIKSNSGTIVDHVLLAGGPEPIVARPGHINDGGVPVYWSHSTDPATTAVTVSCDCPLNGMSLHIPTGAQPAGGFDPPPWDHDAHMTVVDQDGSQGSWEYDFYNVQSRTRAPDAVITIGAGGRTRINGNGVGENPGNPPPAAGNAAHFGLIGGLIRIQELQAGEINHALLMAVPCTNGVPVYPAIEDGQVCPDSQPPNQPNADEPAMGAHLQLNMTQAQIDALVAPAWQKTIYTALRRYGAYVSDTTAQGEPFGFEYESPSTYESFSGYTGQNDPWVQFAGQFGIAPVHYPEDDTAHDQYWFYWTQNGTDNGTPSIDWHNLRVLEPCVAQGRC